MYRGHRDSEGMLNAAAINCPPNRFARPPPPSYDDAVASLRANRHPQFFSSGAAMTVGPTAVQRPHVHPTTAQNSNRVGGFQPNWRPPSPPQLRATRFRHDPWHIPSLPRTPVDARHFMPFSTPLPQEFEDDEEPSYYDNRQTFPHEFQLPHHRYTHEPYGVGPNPYRGLSPPPPVQMHMHAHFTMSSDDDEPQIPMPSHLHQDLYCHACRRMHQTAPSTNPTCPSCHGSCVELVESDTQRRELIGAPHLHDRQMRFRQVQHERRLRSRNDERMVMGSMVPRMMYRDFPGPAPSLERMLAGLMSDGDVPDEAREFFEQLLRRQVLCSPTPPRVISALPTFEKLTADHLSANPFLCNPCAVCLDGLEGTDNPNGAVMVLPCRHGFHKECLVPWLSTARTCPQCRANVVDQQQQ